MGESRGCKKFKSLKKCTWFDSDSKSESKSNDRAKENMNHTSNNTNSCSVISELLLPEELMFDIFTLVPLYCLINSVRYLSKSWASIIGSFYFVEAYERAHSKPGLFVHNGDDQSLSYFLEFKDDLNGQFEITPLGTPPRMGHVHCSCDGMLVLLNYEDQYFVVNPIIKCSFIIPDLGLRSLNQRRYVFVARVPHTTKFKLFCDAVINLSPCGYWYIFYVLRIGIDNTWKEIIRRKAPPSPTYFHKPLKGADNALYWILADVVAVIDIDKEIIVREYPIPRSQFKNRCPETYFIMGNHLYCILRKTSRSSYQLCILNFDSGEWSPYCDLGPYDFVAAYGHEIDMEFWSFSCLINDHIILKVYLRGNEDNCLHFGYNLKTKQLMKIEGINKGIYTVWPRTNSLVPLPSTPT